MLTSCIAAILRWKINNLFLVNILGSFVFGILLGVKSPPKYKLYLGLGFCGALTSYSSWIIEISQLIIMRSFYEVVHNIFIMMFFGLVSMYIGLLTGKRLIA